MLIPNNDKKNKTVYFGLRIPLILYDAIIKEAAKTERSRSFIAINAMFSGLGIKKPRKGNCNGTDKQAR